jgi:nucleoside-diphosphate-sugar epimerase
MCTVTITPAPALKCDAEMMRRFNSGVSLGGLLERAIVWNLFQHLQARGWHVDKVDDGDAVHAVENAAEAMERVFAVEDARVTFRKLMRKRHTVVLIGGNAEDIVSDWNYSEGDADGFNAAMEAFKADAIAPALLAQAMQPAGDKLRELAEAARDFRDCLHVIAWGKCSPERRAELMARYTPPQGSRPMRETEARFNAALDALDAEGRANA